MLSRILKLGISEAGLKDFPKLSASVAVLRVSRVKIIPNAGLHKGGSLISPDGHCNQQAFSCRRLVLDLVGIADYHLS